MAAGRRLVRLPALAHRLPLAWGMYRAHRWRDLVPGAVVLGVILATTAATLKYARIGRLTGDTVHAVLTY